jgi:hypothetical protein
MEVDAKESGHGLHATTGPCAAPRGPVPFSYTTW